MRKGGIAAAVGMGLAAVLLWWARGPGEASPAPERAVAPSVVDVAPSGAPLPPRPASVEGHADTVTVDVVLTERLEAVESSCGLSVELDCVAGRCGGLVAMPDLDRFTGWVDLVWREPRFVASTAARELGVDPDWIPCGVAAAKLGEVTMVRLPDGGQLWCAGDRERCDAGARRRFGVEGFQEEDVRQLAFRLR